MKTQAKLASLAAILGLCLTLALISLTAAHTPVARETASAEASRSHTALSPAALDPTSPTLPVRLIFIHHSTGENWLTDGNGDLGLALRDNNYFVSDTNYGWGPPDQEKGDATIGDHTDIPDWYSWFTGPHRNTYLAALYAESDQHSSYSRLAISPPGIENQVIMFKSCFPNSDLEGNPDDPPAPSADYNSPLTVAHAKRIYLDLLDYFATRQDKLFVVIAAPPLVEGATPAEHAANARAFNNWLVNNWLVNYPYSNVAVFDFYTVLTSNGGNTDTNDLGWSTGNHHRYRYGIIEHIADQGGNYSAYGSSSDDSHPTSAGNLKATGEFVPLLNLFYHRWQIGSSYKLVSARTPQRGETITYTIVLQGLSAPPTATAFLTDSVPIGLSYVTGSLTATSGMVTPTASLLRWSGTLSYTPIVIITYATQVMAEDRRLITNTSTIVVPGYLTLTLDASIIANGYSTYLPLVTKSN